MKKLFLLAAIVAFSFTTNAQEQGDFNGFLGISYPLTSGADLGITGGVEYVFAENFSAAPNFTYYTTSGVTNTSINADVRYYLGDDSFNWFLLAGVSFRNTSAGGVSVSDTGFGGGAGALFSLSDSLNLVAQARYGSSVSAIEPMVGLQFSF